MDKSVNKKRDNSKKKVLKLEDEIIDALTKVSLDKKQKKKSEKKKKSAKKTSKHNEEKEEVKKENDFANFELEPLRIATSLQNIPSKQLKVKEVKPDKDLEQQLVVTEDEKDKDKEKDNYRIISKDKEKREVNSYGTENRNGEFNYTTRRARDFDYRSRHDEGNYKEINKDKQNYVPGSNMAGPTDFKEIKDYEFERDVFGGGIKQKKKDTLVGLISSQGYAKAEKIQAGQTIAPDAIYEGNMQKKDRKYD